MNEATKRIGVFLYLTTCFLLYQGCTSRRSGNVDQNAPLINKAVPAPDKHLPTSIEANEEIKDFNGLALETKKIFQDYSLLRKDDDQTPSEDKSKDVLSLLDEVATQVKDLPTEDLAFKLQSPFIDSTLEAVKRDSAPLDGVKQNDGHKTMGIQDKDLLTYGGGALLALSLPLAIAGMRSTDWVNLPNGKRAKVETNGISSYVLYNETGYYSALGNKVLAVVYADGQPVIAMIDEKYVIVGSDGPRIDSYSDSRLVEFKSGKYQVATTLVEGTTLPIHRKSLRVGDKYVTVLYAKVGGQQWLLDGSRQPVISDGKVVSWDLSSEAPAYFSKPGVKKYELPPYRADPAIMKNRPTSSYYKAAILVLAVGAAGVATGQLSLVANPAKKYLTSTLYSLERVMRERAKLLENK